MKKTVGMSTKDNGDRERTTKEGKDKGDRYDEGGFANKSPEQNRKYVKPIRFPIINFFGGGAQ